MSTIEWKSIYEIGIENIDAQHKQLIEIINRLHEANVTGTSKMIVGEILQELLDYTIFHFNEEEMFLTNHNYPGFDKHKSEHEEFKNKIIKFIDDSKKQQLLISIKVIEYLKEWTISHILGNDKEYAEFIKTS